MDEMRAKASWLPPGGGCGMDHQPHFPHLYPVSVKPLEKPYLRCTLPFYVALVVLNLNVSDPFGPS